MNNIRLVRLLGRGSYGTVYLGEDVARGGRVAVKIISTDSEEALSSVRNEIEALQELKHPNIIELFSVQETETDTRIIMRFAEKGDLLSLMLESRKLSELRARKLFAQILRGVAYAHRHSWIHRDLKLENILLDCDDNAFLADWGLSCRWNPRSFLQESVGSMHYASPEIVSGSLYVGPEVDSWSLGVILYAMVVGAFPFGDNPHAIIAGRFRIPSFVSAECAALISALLEIDPRRRMTVEQALRHPFIVCDEFSAQRSRSAIDGAHPLPEIVVRSPRIAAEQQASAPRTRTRKSMPAMQSRLQVVEKASASEKDRHSFASKVKKLLRGVIPDKKQAASNN